MLGKFLFDFSKVTKSAFVTIKQLFFFNFNVAIVSQNSPKISEISSYQTKAKIKHRHAKRARVIFFVIGAFIELFTVMV